MHTGYRTSLDGGGLWSFGNDFAKNVVIFSFALYHINGSFGAAEKKFNINFIKTKTKFCLKLHYNGDNSFLFIKRKEIYSFKADNGIVNFPTRFCLETTGESKKVR